MKTKFKTISNENKQRCPSCIKRCPCRSCSVKSINSALQLHGEGTSRSANIATSPNSGNPVTAGEVQCILRSEIDSMIIKLEMKVTDVIRTVNKKFTTLIDSNTEHFTKELLLLGEN